MLKSRTLVAPNAGAMGKLNKRSAALKEIIAGQIAAATKKEGITKSRMAARMRMSRREFDRLIDPDNNSVTLRRAPTTLGQKSRVEFG